MLSKDIGKGRRTVVDLRNQEQKKVTVPQPVRIDNNFKAVPKVSAGLGKTFFIILIAIAGVSAIAGWWFLSKPATTEKPSLKIVVDSPREVIAGEPFAIKVNYQNIDIAVLKKMEFNFEHPALWHLQSAEVQPEDSNQSFWRLEDLPVNGSEQLNLMGVIYGEQDQESEFRLKFNYTPENFNSQFSDDVVFKIKITKPYISQIKGLPEKINLDDGQLLTMSYLYSAVGDFISTDFELILPEGVSVATSVPALVGNGWRFDSWTTGETKDLSLQLSASQAVTGQWKMIARQGDLEVGQWQGELKISAPNLMVGLERVGSTNLNLGDQLKLKLKITNNGDAPIDLNKIKLSAETNLINWSAVKIKDAKVENNEIIWSNEQSDNKLLTLGAGKNQEIEFSLPLVARVASGSLDSKWFSIKLNPMITIKNGADLKDVNGQALDINLNQPFSVSTVARYYASADTPVGSGPLPPQVGQKTSYQIIWTVYAGEEGLKNLQLSSSLPSYITWSGQDEEIGSQGTLNFDSASQKITWQLDKLSARQQVTVAFIVSVVPNESQLNQLLILTNASSFTAKKEVTNASVNNNLSLITSELPLDPIASGKGRVRGQ